MRLRFATLDDAAAMAAIYAPVVEQTAISFEAVPPDAAAMRDRLAEHPANMPWIVAELDGSVAGYAYAGVFRARAAYRFSTEVTVYVAAGARRSGVGRRLYRALLALLAGQGYRTVYAGITLPNAASIALHAALGFTPVGVFRAAGFKFERWHDVGFYERILGRLDVPDRDPLDLAELAPATLEAVFGAATG